MNLEFIVAGPPVSLHARKNNAKRYQRWVRTVREAARVNWPPEEQPTNSDLVEASIINYYTEAPPDIDNIIKPILDALNGLVYVDDVQVYRVTSEKRSLSLPIVNPPSIISEALVKTRELVYVEVTWEEEP